MGSTIKQYWHTWLWRDAVTKLITVNFIVWLVVSAVLLLTPYRYEAVAMTAMPSGLHALASRPWTVITYMFTQYDFLHLLVNMLWLMLFGRLFMQTQSGDCLVTLYFYGGLAGAAVFLLYPASGHYLVGSSCAVLAITAAAAAITPRWSVNLLIIGSVQVIWIAVVAAVFFIVLAGSTMQAVAHAAGAAIGIAYALLRRQRIDITAPVMRVLSVLRGKRIPTAQPPHRSSKAYRSAEEELDSLLDKVHLYGYSSLSATQRQRLFDLSQKLKK